MQLITITFSFNLLSKKIRVHNSLHPWSEEISLVEEWISFDSNSKLISDENDIPQIHEIPDQIVEAFNEFFVKVSPNLAGQIPDVHKSFKEYLLPDPVPESFYWLPVTPLEIEDMLKASDQKKACGHDNLPVKLLEGLTSVTNRVKIHSISF